MIKRPTFYAFETAKRAISNAQIGLDVTGHNMSNVSTPGYTRQRVDQVSWSISGISKYQLNKSYYPGMGSQIIGISQTRDPFLDARYRKESSNYGELVIKETGMTDLENIFDEVMSDAMVKGLSSIVSALEDSQKDPNDPIYSLTVRSSIDEFTQMLNRYNGELNTVRTQQISDLQVSIENEVNVMLEKIAALNEEISKLEIYGNPGNELRDERNLLLDQLSGFVDIKVEETKKQITPDIAVNYMKVTINGSACADGNPVVLVDKDKYGKFSLDVSADGKTVRIDCEDAYGTIHAPHVNDVDIKTGAFKGYLDIINGKGTYVAAGDPSEYKGIAFAQEYLDKFAQEFAKLINDVNNANIRDSATGVDLIASSDGSPLTAANIAISQDWRDDPMAIILSNEASSGNPVEAMRFVDALTTKKVDPGLDIPLGLKDSTLEDVITGFQAVLGLEKSRASSLLNTSTNVISALDDQRQAISGVSENEEAINMMTYSNFYNAAVRYMTTIDEALDKIINGMGVVGR